MTVISTAPSQDALGYLGPNAVRPSTVIARDVVPTTDDFNEDIGTMWLEQISDGVFILTSVSSAGATWTKIS